jgi:hypothetical protein
MLRPGLSEVGSPELPQDTALRRAFAQLERTMDQYVNQAKLKLMRRISLKNGQSYRLLLSCADEAVFIDSLLMGT